MHFDVAIQIMSRLLFILTKQICVAGLYRFLLFVLVVRHDDISLAKGGFEYIKTQPQKAHIPCQANALFVVVYTCGHVYFHVWIGRC